MALTTIDAALAQLNANLMWEDSPASARLAQEAIRYLRFNRAQSMGHSGSQLSYEALGAMDEGITRFLSATDATRRAAFTRGRCRR